jgi:hypothetical protein
MFTEVGPLIDFWRSVLPVLSSQQSSASQVSIIVTDSQAILGEVKASGRVFRLNEPLAATLSFENGLCYCEFKPLSILAFGRSRQEAINSFCDDFSMVWDEIAQAPSGSLTPEAQQVRLAFKKLVNSVVPE